MTETPSRKLWQLHSIATALLLSTNALSGKPAHILDTMGSRTRFATFLLVACALNKAPASAHSSRSLLQQRAPAPGASSQIITAILGFGAQVVSIGSNTSQPDPVKDVPGLAPAPTRRAAASSSQILFTCRAIGQQIYTIGRAESGSLKLDCQVYMVTLYISSWRGLTDLCLPRSAGSNGQYNQTGAQADFWCGPSADSKISIKHYFSSRQADGSLREVTDHEYLTLSACLNTVN